MLVLLSEIPLRSKVTRLQGSEVRQVSHFRDCSSFWLPFQGHYSVLPYLHPYAIGLV